MAASHLVPSLEEHLVLARELPPVPEMEASQEEVQELVVFLVAVEPHPAVFVEVGLVVVVSVKAYSVPFLLSVLASY